MLQKLKRLALQHLPTKILAVSRTHVIHELSLMASLSMGSHGSVDRAPAQCLGGHGFNSHQELRFFSFSHAYHVDNFIFISQDDRYRGIIFSQFNTGLK